jgi:hypothetical protein
VDNIANCVDNFAAVVLGRSTAGFCLRHPRHNPTPLSIREIGWI